MNLGTPDAPRPREVRRYLAEFLSDPRVIELPRLRLCANRLGLKFRAAIAFSTASRLSSATRALPFRIRDTVLTETPAIFATSVTVVTPVAGVLFRAFIV